MILGFPKVWEHKGITNKIKQVLCVDNQCIRTFARSPAWGLCVARFDKQGNILGASNREASDSAGLHAFFCVLKFNHFL